MRITHYWRTAACMLFSFACMSCVTEIPYPPRLEPDETFVQPSQNQKLWALATTAVLTESNRRRHDLLGGCERTPTEIKAWQDSLLEWWGVHNRVDLLNTLKWIENGGHRKEFNKIATLLSSATPESLAEIRRRAASDPSINNRIEIVLRYKDEFGKKSIIAWDYDRYISLCGWGYIAGYLSEDEAWRKIMPAARLLQSTFESWRDLGRNHVVGREFWSFEHTQRNGAYTRQCYEKLLTIPLSPWVRLKWNLNLSGLVAAEIERGNIYNTNKQYSQALESYSKAIELDPNNPEAFNSRGWISFFYTGNKNRGLMDLEKASEIDPSSSIYARNLGLAYMYNGSYEKAVAYMNRVVELKPEDEWSYIQRGRVYDKAGTYEMALKDFDMALEINPANDKAYQFVVLAFMNIYAIRYDNLARATQTEPKNNDEYLIRGLAYLRTGKYQLALDDFDFVCKADPKKMEAYLYRASTYGALKKLTDKIDNLKAAARLDSKYAQDILASKGIAW